MNICIIGTVGVPASYGGFETLVESLIEEKSLCFYVYCSKPHYSEPLEEYKNAKLVYVPLNANGISSIFYDILSILHALLHGQKNFLVLGVSGAIIFPFLRCIPKVKVVTNIDGIEWRRNKWSGFAKLFLRFSEYLAVKFSSIVVADNAAISGHIKNNYGRSCEIIAYGGDHAVRAPNKVKSKEGLQLEKSYALSLCRIEPENNVHMILEGCSSIGFPIVFIGNWDNSDYGRFLYGEYKNNKYTTLVKPIYCLDALFHYRANCSVYLHGHSAGGTNPSLVEMMHFSKPIIAFDCPFNRATMDNKGNYFNSSYQLANLLGNVDSLEKGNVLKEIAQRRYTWDIVRKQYLELFKI